MGIIRVTGHVLPGDRPRRYTRTGLSVAQRLSINGHRSVPMSELFTVHRKICRLGLLPRLPRSERCIPGWLELVLTSSGAEDESSPAERGQSSVVRQVWSISVAVGPAPAPARPPAGPSVWSVQVTAQL